MQIDPSVFKAYDIRGIVDRSIDERFAEHLGRAFGSEAVAAGERAVAVGRDGRLSGPALAAALIRGLASTGLDVVDLGAVTTPMLYYVAATRGAHGCSSGIQVTGSHNPKNYNGFKMVLAGRAIHGAEIQGLRRRIEAEAYTQGQGRSATMNIAAEYRARIVGVIELVDLARSGNRPLADVAGACAGLDAGLDLAWLSNAIANLPASNRWQARARAQQASDLRTLRQALLQRAPLESAVVNAGRAVVEELKRNAPQDLAMLSAGLIELKRILLPA